MVAFGTKSFAYPEQQSPEQILADLADPPEEPYTAEQDHCMLTVERLLDELDETYRRFVWKRREQA
jgi:hypothetical protein